MNNKVIEVIEIGEKVKKFITDENGYSAVTFSGRFLNIIQCKILQPEVKDQSNFITYMWVEAKEGFFILSQRIKDFKTENWVLEKQIIPGESFNFFVEYGDRLQDVVKK